MDVVIIPSIAWNFPLYQRVHHFADKFVRDGNRVLFIEPTTLFGNRRVKKGLEAWCPRVKGAAFFYAASKKRHEWEKTYRGVYRFFQLVKMLGGFKLYHSFKGAYESRIHYATRKESFDRKVKRKLGDYAKSRRKVAIFQYPHYVEYLPYLRELGFKVVYDLVDDISGFRETPKEVVADEKRLMEEADLVVATAKPLATKARRHNRRVTLIANGAECGHFRRARGKGKRPYDMPKGKIVGYYGAIWNWFDAELVMKVARKRPGYEFVLIGTCKESIGEKLKKLDNVTLLGEKKYERLPEYLRFFDVAFIPFRVNKLTESVNPVKAFEFLAGGKPIVSTDIPELRGFPCTHIVENAGQAAEKIDLAMKNGCDKKKADAFLKDKDWENRYEELTRKVRGLW